MTPVKVGLIGGQGGDTKDIHPSQLPRNLEKIEIWSSGDGVNTRAVINGIRFTYVDSNGRRHTIPSRQGDAWGAPSGNLHEIKIDTGAMEYVTKIEGSVGQGPDGDRGITSLKITTSRGYTYGPYGDPNNGHPFHVPLANSGIFAFFASADTYLNAVGFYVQPYP